MAYRILSFDYHGKWSICARRVIHIIHFPFWLGDFVMTLPAAHAWCNLHAGDRLIAVIDPSLAGLLKRSGLPVEHWVFSKKDRSFLVEQLKKEAPDSVFMLTNSFGSLWPYVSARVKQRTGFGGQWTRWMLSHRGNREWLKLPQGDRWFQLLGLKNKSTTPFLIKSQNDVSAVPQLLVFPGAKYGPAKQWDVASYAEVISRCQAKGWDVILMGTPAEKADAAAIEQVLKQPVRNFCGQMDLLGLLDFLEGLSHPVVLANDSGAMHLLAACGIPTLGMYFSTSALNTPPAFGPFDYLEANVDCRPCYARTCPLKHYNCRSAIGPEMVVEKLESLV
jgi:heptosyltransferase II